MSSNASHLKAFAVKLFVLVHKSQFQGGGEVITPYQILKDSIKLGVFKAKINTDKVFFFNLNWFKFRFALVTVDRLSLTWKNIF